MEMLMAWEKWAVLRDDEPRQIFDSVEEASLAMAPMQLAESDKRWAIREVQIRTDVAI